MVNESLNTLFADGSVPVMVIAILSIVLGLVESFFGYRVFKIQVAIIAFLAGLGIGLSAFGAVFNIQWLVVALALLLGLLLGWLSMKIYKVGVFLVVASLAFTVAYGFVSNVWFGLIAGVIVGVLGVVLTKHILIITTAISGGGMVASGISTLIWGQSQAVPFWLQLVLVLALGVAGSIVQYRTTRDIE